METNTTLSAGSCTLAAERMAARLRAAGYKDGDIRLFGVPDHPKEGGLVATLDGTDSKAKAILLLAHIDVVEAKREDWSRDPFVLVEEHGYFYGRGSSDDKAQAAIFTDTLIRLKQAGPRLRRPLKLALTCGEETARAFNGAHWLVTEHKDWIDAQFALNEEASACAMPAARSFHSVSRRERRSIRISESKRATPVATAAGRARITRFTVWPRRSFASVNTSSPCSSPTPRCLLHRDGKTVRGETGAAMMRLIADPNDLDAGAIVSKDPITRCCAPPALQRGSMAGMPTMRWRSARAPTSIAGCFPATRSTCPRTADQGRGRPVVDHSPDGRDQPDSGPRRR